MKKTEKMIRLQAPLHMFGRSGELTIVYKDTPGNTTTVQDCVQAVLAETQRLDCLLSSENPNSEIAELNQYAGKEYVRVSRETMHLLYKAKLQAESKNSSRVLMGCPASQDPLSFLKLMPQGKYGYGYEESMADNLYGGYIGGIAMITKPLDGETVDISRAAIPYILDQIADILKWYGFKNAKLRIGEYRMTGRRYSVSSPALASRSQPQLLVNAAGAY